MREHDPRPWVHDKAAEVVALYGMGLLMGLVVEADVAWTWLLPGLGLLWLLLVVREPSRPLTARERAMIVRAARLEAGRWARPRPTRGLHLASGSAPSPLRSVPRPHVRAG
jgi:hypothetical protein